MIYGIPFYANTLPRLDPDSDTITIIGDAGSGTLGWFHGVLANTGVIYGIPFYASTVLRIDPASDSIC